ncbi:MAG: TonB-dependent receptor plug domain-containing protein [Lentisphaeria bacterium]
MQRNTTRKPRNLIAGGLVALALSGVVRAQEASDTAEPARELSTLVVTGTRLTKNPVDQPYAFYHAPDAELELRVGRTALDRFNYGPGVFVQRTAPNQASPFIRGLTGEQTLLMLDGVRFNHAMMRPGPNQYASLIPSLSLNALDAILGSSSTVNGSDGLTGALDYRLDPAGRGVDSAVSPWMETRFDTGNGATLELGVDGVSNDWAYSIEFSGSD